MFEEKKLPLSEKLEISDNKNFGWKVKEEIEEGGGKKKIKYVVLTRDKNLRNYITLSNLEKRYYDAKNQIKPLPKINEIALMFLLLLGIIPEVIYISVKKKNIKMVEENNSKMKKEMASIIQEGEQYKR
jgi:hypothetical protein